MVKTVDCLSMETLQRHVSGYPQKSAVLRQRLDLGFPKGEPVSSRCCYSANVFHQVGSLLRARGRAEILSKPYASPRIHYRYEFAHGRYIRSKRNTAVFGHSSYRLSHLGRSASDYRWCHGSDQLVQRESISCKPVQRLI